MKSTQEVWKQSESDNWFDRNKLHLGSHSDRPDHVLRIIEIYGLQPSSVLELGGANGFRVAELQRVYNCEGMCVEPSASAVDDGKKTYPNISFVQETVEEFQPQTAYDLTIVNFVLHWVGRDGLFKALNTIDASVKEGGYLIVGDFGTTTFRKRHYHHRTDVELYTFKAEYRAMFLASGLYEEVATLHFDYSTREFNTNNDVDNSGVISLLKKNSQYHQES